jgi:hypothetical protein
MIDRISNSLRLTIAHVVYLCWVAFDVSVKGRLTHV